MHYNLFDEQWKTIELMKEAAKYGDYLCIKNKVSKLNILNEEATLDCILNNPKSISRFGDGELMIIMGHSISFQEYNELLAKRLEEVLTTKYKNIYIGLGYRYFNYDIYNEKNMVFNKFYTLEAPKYRKFLLQKCHKEITYISTEFNQRYYSMEYAEMENWYSKVKKIFYGKEIVVFIGEAAYKGLQYNLFEEASGVEYVLGASRNAFKDYDTLLRDAKKYKKSKLLCFILGPTSTVLAYDLAREGYLAYDIGHLAKDYQCYMSRKERCRENISAFFAPDD